MELELDQLMVLELEHLLEPELDQLLVLELERLLVLELDPLLVLELEHLLVPGLDHLLALNISLFSVSNLGESKQNANVIILIACLQSRLCHFHQIHSLD